jgi:hypothetical protein
MSFVVWVPPCPLLGRGREYVLVIILFVCQYGPPRQQRLMQRELHYTRRRYARQSQYYDMLHVDGVIRGV